MSYEDRCKWPTLSDRRTYLSLVESGYKIVFGFTIELSLFHRNSVYESKSSVQSQCQTRDT